MELKNKSITEFAELLASREPVPGGGGASALVAALGMALGSMVANFTLGKKKYAHVEEDIKALILESEKIQDQLISCIDKDAKAFEPLSRAYSIPKEEPGRPQALEKYLKDAALVPMEILQLSCR
ncbi:MAG: sugar ABC transporter substrate-binding protein, partial [Synergistetes bacterium HGW-Synergistetes-2]